jgi:hypothetical protein
MGHMPLTDVPTLFLFFSNSGVMLEFELDFLKKNPYYVGFLMLKQHLSFET